MMAMSKKLNLPLVKLAAQLPDGTQIFYAQATDKSGKTSAKVPLSLIVSNPPGPDTEKPTVTLTAPTQSGTQQSPLHLSADAHDNDRVKNVTFYESGRVIFVDTTAPYDYSAALTPGLYNITATAEDASGNVSLPNPTTPIPITIVPPPIPGDIRPAIPDGCIDDLDMSYVVFSYGKTVPINDIRNVVNTAPSQTVIDDLDVSFMIPKYGNGCSGP
jgi:hypothetical protein